ncbi:MAG: cation diffusion facilitator family transporter [Acidobacteria bacterium]|nr:cation diffusion facilitator family transporter [Acidobacteriota bacterium]
MVDEQRNNNIPQEEVKTSIARLFITMALNILITIAQAIGGLISGSLSLLSDAVHNLSDAVSIIISYIAIRLSRYPNSIRYTFGLKRAEILAAVVNAAALIIICFFLLKEAYERLLSHRIIAGGIMVSVALVGLIANVVGTLLLKEGSKHNINIRSSYLHLLGDTVSSVAVILGGLAIIFFKIYWLDPLLTALISIYIVRESLTIVKEALAVLMMGVPESISIEDIRTQIEGIPNIKNIHHVHVWRLSEKDIHFEAHIDVEEMTVSETCGLGNTIREKLKNQYGINHVTLQFETDKCVSKRLV